MSTISDGSSSSSDLQKSSAVVPKRKAKNLLGNLGDLPTSGANMAPLLDPLSILSKRPPANSSYDSVLKKAKDKSSAKSADDSNPLSMWLEDCLPPLPPQPSPSLGRKSSSGSYRESHPSLGEGIVGSPSMTLQLDLVSSLLI